MKALLCHALIITGVLFGGDFRFNGGQDTEALMSALRAELVVKQAQLHAHHVNEDLERHITMLLPVNLRH